MTHKTIYVGGDYVEASTLVVHRHRVQRLENVVGQWPMRRRHEAQLVTSTAGWPEIIEPQPTNLLLRFLALVGIVN